MGDEVWWRRGEGGGGTAVARLGGQVHKGRGGGATAPQTKRLDKAASTDHIARAVPRRA